MILNIYIDMAFHFSYQFHCKKKNKFKGGIWFLKAVLSFSSAVSWSGWDGGTDLWLLTMGSESPRVLLHPRQYPGVDGCCQGEEQVGWGRHKPSLLLLSCYILLRARKQEKPLFKGRGGPNRN